MKSEEDWFWQERDGKHKQCVEKQKHYSAEQRSRWFQGHILSGWGMAVRAGPEGSTAEHERFDAPQTVVLEKTPGEPLRAEIKNQVTFIDSTLNIHWRTEAEASSILAIWCNRMTHCGRVLMLGKIEDRRRRECHRAWWLDGIINTMNMNFWNLWEWWGTGKFDLLQSMGLQRVDITVCNWTTHSKSYDTIIC